MTLKTTANAKPLPILPYGIGRNSLQGPQISLDFQFRNGNRHGFSYAFLSEIEYDASGVIRLVFGGTQVEIRGRNLLELYERLLLHGVGYVLESPKAARGDTWPFIETISVRKEES